ncbi:pyridoxal phosphate-dependent aminotransferase [Alisedimentitalea sp. MJ-SS2]|nr:pyridoxal phosphate-dependent aminotransferase [Alisedimentitalea sp. MJ-SS2]
MQQDIQGFHPSDRAASLSLSEIVQISEAAARLRAEGKPVLSFGTGEPDFPTPPHVIEAAHKAALDGKTTYPATQGVGELRNAIATRAGFTCDPTQVIVSTGAKQVLSNAFLASLNPGDEVIVAAPYWTSYRDIIEFCQGRVVPVACPMETGFLLTPEALEAAITDKTRWLLLNTPGNPSGAMYSEAQLGALADVLRRHPHVWVIADEIYQHIAYQPFTSFVNAAPDLAARVLIVNGVSKAHAMTGWRLGWGIGPADLIRTMVAVQGQSTSGACSISQAAALAAVTGPQDHLASRNSEFRRRRDFVVKALSDTPGLDCPTPQGAFYVYPSCRGVFGKRRPDGRMIEDDAAFCEFLLTEANVALVPGRAFGLAGHFRLSYAYAMGELQEGLARIARAVNTLT